MSESTEKLIWKGCPAAASDFWIYLSCLLVLPIPYALWRWWQRRCHVIEITTERIRVTQGMLSKRVDEVELYRVRDHTFIQPFALRIFGCGNLVLNTADLTTPEVTLSAIPAAPELRDSLRRAIEDCRDRKRARVTEIEGGLDDHSPH